MRGERSTGRNRTYKTGSGEEIEITYHTYVDFGKHILKESHWYNMISTAKETLKPQTEEDITEIQWVKKDDLKSYLDNTFPTIISVLESML